MPVHWSLSYLRDKGYGLTAFCGNQNCRHSQDLDWNKLIEAFGPDFVIPNAYDRFISRLKCSDCGGRRITIILCPPTERVQTTGH